MTEVVIEVSKTEEGFEAEILGAHKLFGANKWFEGLSPEEAAAYAKDFLRESGIILPVQVK